MDKPILGIRCKNCGRVYFGHALTYIINTETAKEIQQAALQGDEIFIADGDEFKLETCKCEMV